MQNKFKSFLSNIFGSFSWNSPPWISRIKNQAHVQPKLFWGSILGFIAFVCIGFASYYYYQHLPQEKKIIAKIRIPTITPNEKILVPSKLTINFGIDDNGFTSQSVAPLKQIGKEITSGLKLSPTMPGKWTWASDSQIIFTPKEDWPAGQQYHISFSKDLFRSDSKFEKLNYDFSTHPFHITINEFKFYQDPIDIQIKQAIATLQFNYPVNPASLEKNIQLKFEDETAKNLKFNIHYDENKRTAYIQSEPIALPKTESFLQLILNKGITAFRSNDALNKVIRRSILIPDAGNYFKITAVQASMVRNSKDRPEQVLNVETTIGVQESDLKKFLQVYLLPQDYPATSNEEDKKNYEWQNPGEVTPDVLALSTPIKLQSLPSNKDYATLHSFTLNAPTPRYMYVKIPKGLVSYGQYTLSRDYQTIIKVPEYPKEITFLHKGSLLALSGEKKISVIVRGLPAVKFQVARVLPDDINHLITQTQGNFNDPHFINPSFDQKNISEIFSEIQTFDTNDPAKAQYSALNLERYLNQQSNPQGPLGIFLLQATGWNNKEKTALDVNTQRLVLITDLGFIVKDNSNGSHDVFVQSITKGLPVVHAKVSILGKNGLPILSQMTDEQGHISFPSLKDFTDEKEPTVYLAALGNDISFIPFNNADRQLNYSRYDVGGIYNNNSALQTLSAFVFSDRGLYRPGDIAHIAAIVKQAYATKPPKNLPIQVIVTDPRGNTIQDERINLDETGMLSFDIKTDTNSTTGEYAISVYVIKDNHPDNLLGSTSIKVAEFEPDRMRITANFSNPSLNGWMSPEGLSANIGLWNLYGAPAANRKISTKILLKPQAVKFDEFPGYIFTDPLIDPDKPAKVFTDNLSQATTNDQGLTNIPLNLERFNKATYELTLYAEGFESEGGRSVTTEIKSLVSPLPYFIGYKTEGNLNFIRENIDFKVQFIGINPQLKSVAIQNLKLQLFALRPITTLVKNPNGTYQYKSIIQESLLSSTPFNIEATGTKYPLPNQQIGDFKIVLLDAHNTELSKFNFSIVGKSQIPLSKNAELTVKLNKAEYSSDEDIELTLSAPYEGSGLITVERDKVYTYQWFKTTTSNSIQKIHIPKDFQGNGYVIVTFVRNWDSPEIFTSPLSYSATPFKVNNTKHAINIELNVPSLALPGQVLPIQFKSDKPGKIILFGVDEGILQAATFQTPDPLNYFFQKRALEVLTQQTVDQILPKYEADRELSAVGGDGRAAALKLNLNPFKRKTDLPVVFWSGILNVDSNVQNYNYRVPDYFNGALKIMAVASSIDAVGSANKNVEIKGPIIINPNAPTFVAPNDEFEVSASIANNVKNSGENVSTNIQLTVSSGLEIIGSKEKSLSISENHEGTVAFKLKAKPLLGSHDITLIANIGDKSSKRTVSLSIRPANPFDTDILSGRSNDKEKILVPNLDLYPEFKTLEASISTTPIIFVNGLNRYLDNFPYGCTEQLVSKAMPLLALADQTASSSINQKITKKIATTIQMLSQRQMANGGFSYWPDFGENKSNVFASIYAMHFLTEVKAAGYVVPIEMFRSGLNYLKELASQNVSNLSDARNQAYAIYILTRNEIVTTNYLTNLDLYLQKQSSKVWQEDIMGAYMASTYQLLKSYANANRLIAHFKPSMPSQIDYDNFYKDSSNAQYLYLIAKHFPDMLNTVGNKLLPKLISSMNNDEINTVISGYTSLALNAYGKTYTNDNSIALTVKEILPNRKENIIPINQLTQKINLNTAAIQLTIINSNHQTFFYQFTQAGFNKKVSTTPIKQGIEITREYRDVGANSSVQETQLGNEIEVHIKVRSLSTTSINNVAIVDLLPGGFEVVRGSTQNDLMDFSEPREDRVLFFGTINPEVKEIVYRIKATSRGNFIIPPIMAHSMYEPTIKARDQSGIFKISK